MEIDATFYLYRRFQDKCKCTHTSLAAEQPSSIVENMKRSLVTIIGVLVVAGFTIGIDATVVQRKRHSGKNQIVVQDVDVLPPLLASAGTAGLVGALAKYYHNKATKQAKTIAQQAITKMTNDHRTILARQHEEALFNFEELNGDFLRIRETLQQRKLDLRRLTIRLNAINAENVHIQKTSQQLSLANVQLRKQIAYWREAAQTAEAKYERALRKAEVDMIEEHKREQQKISTCVGRLDNLERQTFLLRKTLPQMWNNKIANSQ